MLLHQTRRLQGSKSIQIYCCSNGFTCTWCLSKLTDLSFLHNIKTLSKLRQHINKGLRCTVVAQYVTWILIHFLSLFAVLNAAFTQYQSKMYIGLLECTKKQFGLFFCLVSQRLSGFLSNSISNFPLDRYLMNDSWFKC